MTARMGPLDFEHPSVGDTCPACKQCINTGAYVTIVPLGPGDDPEAQALCLAGRPYTAIFVVVHYACATGDAS